MILIDTDIIIWILRGNTAIKNQFIKIVYESKGTIFITPIQIAEIYAGIKEKERINTELFLNTFITISIDYQIGKLAGEYLNEFSKSHNVTLSDAMIAASTKLHGLKLWTANTKHYPMLDKEDIIE